MEQLSPKSGNYFCEATIVSLESSVMMDIFLHKRSIPSWVVLLNPDRPFERLFRVAFLNDPSFVAALTWTAPFGGSTSKFG